MVQPYLMTIESQFQTIDSNNLELSCLPREEMLL